MDRQFPQFEGSFAAAQFRFQFVARLPGRELLRRLLGLLFGLFDRAAALHSYFAEDLVVEAFPILPRVGGQARNQSFAFFAFQPQMNADKHRFSGEIRSCFICVHLRSSVVLVTNEAWGTVLLIASAVAIPIAIEIGIGIEIENAIYLYVDPDSDTDPEFP